MSSTTGGGSRPLTGAPGQGYQVAPRTKGKSVSVGPVWGSTGTQKPVSSGWLHGASGGRGRRPGMGGEPQPFCTPRTITTSASASGYRPWNS